MPFGSRETSSSEQRCAALSSCHRPVEALLRLARTLLASSREEGSGGGAVASSSCCCALASATSSLFGSNRRPRNVGAGSTRSTSLEVCFATTTSGAGLKCPILVGQIGRAHV